jgi:CHAD domain-containing protein
VKPARLELRRGEAIADGLERMVGRLAGGAETRVAKSGDEQSAVHDVRLAIKRFRALLRLTRAGGGEEFFKAHDKSLREAAERLAPTRDAHVAARTLGQLREKSLAPEDRAALKSVQERFRVKSPGVTAAKLRLALREASRSLREAARAWGARPTSGRGWGLVEPGFRKMCRQYLARMDRALASGRDLDFHEWRKRAKFLGYQARMIRPIWPKRLVKLEKRLDKLQEILGADHDLSVLKGLLRTHPEMCATPAEKRRVLACLRKASGLLRRQAKTASRRVFREKPDLFLRRLRERGRKFHKAAR